jgi:hypothetical protein
MKILMMIFCLLTLTATAQDALPVGENGMVTFEDVVEVPKMPKGLLFENAKSWIASYYKSPRTIQEEDDMEGTISTRSMFRIKSEPGGTKPGGVINYTMDIKVRAGKYKYSISNLRHSDKTEKIGSGGKLERSEPLCGHKEMKEEQWQGIKAQTKSEVEKLIEAFKKGMEYTSPDDSDDF